MKGVRVVALVGWLGSCAGVLGGWVLPNRDGGRAGGSFEVDFLVVTVADTGPRRALKSYVDAHECISYERDGVCVLFVLHIARRAAFP